MVIILIITRQDFNQVTIIMIIASLSPCNNYDYYMALELKDFAAFGYKSVCIKSIFTRPFKSFDIIECALFTTIFKHRKILFIRHIFGLLTNIYVALLNIFIIRYLSN